MYTNLCYLTIKENMEYAAPTSQIYYHKVIIKNIKIKIKIISKHIEYKPPKITIFISYRNHHDGIGLGTLLIINMKIWDESYVYLTTDKKKFISYF